MKRLILLILIAASIIASEQSLQAQTIPTKAWDKTYGGDSYEGLGAIQQTFKGGYILGGSSMSFPGFEKSQYPFGAGDFWVVMVDANGTKLWDKIYGGGSIDVLKGIQQTADGGYILAGDSESGISPAKSQPSKGESDYWIIKIDSLGNKLWDKSYGGNLKEYFSTLIQTSDKGFILAGWSNSGISGDKTQASKGGDDYWIVKIDSLGNKQWDKTFGGFSHEWLRAIRQTSDGGYIVVGGTNSTTGPNGDVSQQALGDWDYWVLKLDSNGNKVWDKTFGGTGEEYPSRVLQAQDGGYLIGGSSDSNTGIHKSQNSKGIRDYWILKLDSVGNKIWDKTIGGNYIDDLYSIEEKSDKGFILSGLSLSYLGGDKSQPTRGQEDYWIVKVDSLGNKLWDVSFGGDKNDLLVSFKPTSDGGYIAGGTSWSGLIADKTQVCRGYSDFWVVKLNPTCADLAATLSSSCSSSGTAVNVNIAGIQVVTGSNPSWSLTYTVNGVTQTATGTTNNFTLASNGTSGTVYTLVSIASGTCTKSLTNSLTVPASLQQPTINLISPDTLISSVTGSSYIWKLNNAALPNTIRKLKATSNGTYAVQVKDANNCTSAFSQDYAFTISGLKEMKSAEIKLYPNPTNGMVNLEFANPINAQVKVYNALGQCILTKTVSKQEKETTLDLANAAKGIYTILAITGKQRFIKKVMLE